MKQAEVIEPSQSVASSTLGLGSSLTEVSKGGPRGFIPHKLSRDASSISSSSVLYVDRSLVPHSLPVYRQHCNSLLPEPQRRGDFPLLCMLAKQWCMSQTISLAAKHLLGNLNSVVDRESRESLDRWFWLLHPKIFFKISNLWGLLTIDLLHPN